VKLMTTAVVLTVILCTTQIHPTFAGDIVVADANAALNKLYAKESVAKMLSEKAAGILVFPNIVKAGFIVGGHYGEGVLLRDGKLVAHYNSVAASYGLQAGVQSFGYVLFLMNDKTLQYLDSSNGWEIGVGPSIVIVDAGKAKSMTTLTLKDDVYAFIFNQQGLMAGLGLQGSKITKLDK
jgi:lipid-binding SYLF domain-containing protein